MLLLSLESVSNILTIVLTYFFYKSHSISQTQVDRSARPAQQFITWLCCVQSALEKENLGNVQMTEGGIASGLYWLMCCCVKTSANCVMVGAAFPQACALNGDISTIVTATLTFSFICDVDQPIRLLNPCTLTAEAIRT